MSAHEVGQPFCTSSFSLATTTHGKVERFLEHRGMLQKVKVLIINLKSCFKVPMCSVAHIKQQVHNMSFVVKKEKIPQNCKTVLLPW